MASTSSPAKAVLQAAAAPYAVSGPHPIAAAFFGLAAFTVLFVAAVLALKWLQKRMGNRFCGAGGGIRVVTRRFLGGQNTLLIAEVGDRRYLLSSSRAGVSLVDRLPSDATDSDHAADFP